MSWNVLECSSDKELSMLPKSGLNVYWKQGKVCASKAHMLNACRTSPMHVTLNTCRSVEMIRVKFIMHSS